MVHKIISFIQFLLGYCSECDQYFKYFKKEIHSVYNPVFYPVCKNCHDKMNKMVYYEWVEYHLGK